jgi:hypothetical protein
MHHLRESRKVVVGGCRTSLQLDWMGWLSFLLSHITDRLGRGG